MWCHLEGDYFLGGVFWEIHIHIWGGILGNSHTYLGGYSGKFTYILGGVFWEIHIHIWGGILGNSHTYLGGGILET